MKEKIDRGLILTFAKQDFFLQGIADATIFSDQEKDQREKKGIDTKKSCIVIEKGMRRTAGA